MCDHPDREAAMVEVAENVWCDPCIVPLVDALHAGGFRTIASCCGHGRRPSQVALADGREVIVARSYEEARRFDELFPDINAPLAEDASDDGRFPIEPYPAHAPWFARLRDRLSRCRDGDANGSKGAQ